MDLHDDWKEFCGLLNANGVEYLVVGAIGGAKTGFHPLHVATQELIYRYVIDTR